MKIFSLQQPWASLCFTPRIIDPKRVIKEWETRSYSRQYRGELLIHASKTTYTSCSEKDRIALRCLKLAGYVEVQTVGEIYCAFNIDQRLTHLPFGQIIGVVTLADILPMTKKLIESQDQLNIEAGIWDETRFAWKLENPRVLTNPIPFKGKLGFLNPSDTILEEVNRQLKE